MEVTVSGKHIEVTEPIREYAEEKANRAARYFNGVTSMDVILDKTDSHTFDCELIAHINGHDNFVATGKHADLYACIDETSSKIERQIHDHKEKIKNHKHG
ncbi:ribosome-associated translation inhibitor RaiA [Planctomycetota bacterium]|nr:ribosome-associated translation inhibitor RaiA [Planctomycetota bacterium]